MSSNGTKVVKCIEIFKDAQNNPYAYVVLDKNNTEKVITRLELQNLIKSKNIRVIGLEKRKEFDKTQSKVTDKRAEVTRDIIKKVNCNKRLSFKQTKKLNSIEIKAKIIGADFKYIGNNIYLVSQSDKITLVSKYEIHLTDSYFDEKEGRIVGLFNHTDFKSIDLTGVHTENMTNMYGMFSYINLEYLKLENLIQVK